MKAVIFDLDGTLLPMDTNHFMNLYAKSITQAFDSFEESEMIFPQIMTSIGVTVKDKNNKCNYDVFFDHFESHMPQSRDVYIPVFDKFYQSAFDQVRASTYVSNDIVKAVSILKEKGYRLIIATNPIFPMAANRRRIQWAGLEFNDFDHVTSFESNHFCKPHLEFYQEVLDHNDLRAEEVLMVGNDVQEDLCIKALGASTYLINDHKIDRHPETAIQTDHQGSYNDFLHFVEGLDELV